MVLSEHLEHLKEDLVRMLKGGNVGEVELKQCKIFPNKKMLFKQFKVIIHCFQVVEERLYFAVNTTQDGDQLF